MARPVTDAEIENTSPQLVNVSTTPILLSATRLGLARRRFFSIVPNTSGVTVTIVKGGELGQVTALTGIPIVQSQPYIEQDSPVNPETGLPNAPAFQGPIYLVASAAGTVSFTEVFEP